MIDLRWDRVREEGIVVGDEFNTIREVFSVENKGAKFQKFNPWLAERKYAITPTGRFEPGLCFEIEKYVLTHHPGVRITIDPELAAHVVKPIDANPFKSLAVELRYYQHEIVEKCLKQGRGTVVLATAGGKTLTMASLINSVHAAKKFSKDFKCLVIVPNISLVSQTYNDFIKYGVTFSVTRWTGDLKPDLDRNVIIANLAILQSESSDIEWIKDIDLLVVDEVHGLRYGNKFNKLIKQINTDHRFGFTGTLPENKLDQWNIIGKIGPVIYEKDAADLEKEGYVAPVKAVVLQVCYKQEPDPITTPGALPTERYRRELNFLMHHPFRNRVIATLCNKLDNNCLIMVDYIEHGEGLYKVLKEKCPSKQVFFIRGDVEVEERAKVTAMMETEQNVVCVAISKIFSTGINILQLPYLIFASGGKAKVRVIQSVGRGRRLHENKKQLIIFDIADQLKYSLQHSISRQKLYDIEEIPFGTKLVHET